MRRQQRWEARVRCAVGCAAAHRCAATGGPHRPLLLRPAPRCRVCAQDKYGNSPLMAAASYKKDVAQLLLERNADVNAQACVGAAPRCCCMGMAAACCRVARDEDTAVTSS